MQLWYVYVWVKSNWVQIEQEFTSKESADIWAEANLSEGNTQLRWASQMGKKIQPTADPRAAEYAAQRQYEPVAAPPFQPTPRMVAMRDAIKVRFYNEQCDYTPNADVWAYIGVGLDGLQA